jgi:hypothetical protein
MEFLFFNLFQIDKNIIESFEINIIIITFFFISTEYFMNNCIVLFMCKTQTKHYYFSYKNLTEFYVLLLAIYL